MERYDYKGCVHLHSIYSDGKGTIEEIMQGANGAGLDYVVLTDHNKLTAADEGHEKWHGSTLLIIGTEISPPENHYIAWGPGPLAEVATLRGRPPQAYVDAVRESGWVGFLAHPNYVGTKKFGSGSYRWTDWSVKGFTGLSIWNLLDDWKRQLDRENVTPQEVYDEFPRHLTGPEPEILAKWDELLRQGPVVAIGELDNHKMTRRYDEREFVVFPYEQAFRTVTNHLLLEEPLSRDAAEAKKQVVEAFRKGSLYISFDWEDDPTEFSFTVEHDDGVAYPGDQFNIGEEDEIWISLPQEAEIRLIRNGSTLQEIKNFELVAPLREPGVYRVEIRRDGFPWIFSNPVFALPPA